MVQVKREVRPCRPGRPFEFSGAIPKIWRPIGAKRVTMTHYRAGCNGLNGVPGGFYSYDRLENLVGADIHSADEILPEFQEISPGDRVYIGQRPPPHGGGGARPGWQTIESRVAQKDRPVAELHRKGQKQ